MKRAALPLMLMLCSLSPARAGMMETILDLNGKLNKQDQTLPGGEFADVYPLDLQAGDRVIIDMTARKLDTYLVLRSPSDQVFENDDLGQRTHSQIELFAEESGTYLIYATSAAAGEKGAYSLRVALDSSGRGAVPVANNGVEDIAPGQAVQGSLSGGDATLTNGEWVDHYRFSADAGQLITVDMTSAEVDTYLALQSPSEEIVSNDDFEGSSSHSRIEHVAEESGDWIIYATSYEAGDEGGYDLSVEVGAPPEETSQDGPTRWSGTLDSSDSTISTGEYIEIFEVEGAAGAHWVVDLRSSAFDPFLIVKSPSGEQVQNDDFEGDQNRSLIDMPLTESGTYTIAVTTYQPGETGRFDLTLRAVDGSSVASGSQRYSGEIGPGDSQLESGEWFDRYTFEGLPGQHVNIEVSGDYDTYLGVIGPTSFREENDDGDSSTHSQIEAVLSEAGTHQVLVTSYEPGQSGSYNLTIDIGDASDEVEGQRDVTTLASGQVAAGTLEQGDLTLQSGEFQDRYTLDVQAGQAISVTMRSTEFDTYLGLHMPDESVLENDDWESDRATSHIEAVAPVSGRYRVIATSYRPGEGGAYTVEAQVGGAASAPPTHHAYTGDQGEIYGVFVGISDYPDDGPSDLSFTAEDARAMHSSLQQIGMPADNGVVLTDSSATREAVVSAIRQQSAKMGDSDLLVVFYSGHGGRQARTEHQAADPDGYDETLALYDGQVTDDEFAEIFAEIDSGKVLLVLDSCFSGGFSKDIISRPDRMGLFSSHEDVTSAVAVKFRAGGYLARFMSEAIGERRADENGDNALTSLELSQYLYERYRSDVKSDYGKSDGAYEDIVLSGRNLGYQQLIVDRGSFGPSQVLFTW